MRPLVILIVGLSLFAAEVAIDFCGNSHFSKEELYEAIGIEQSFWERWRKKLPRVEDKLLPILLEELQSFYKDQGYWHATIDPRYHEGTVTFCINEGSPILVSHIEIYSDFPIKKLISLHKGSPFVATKFVETKERIKHALLEAGYCSYNFRPKAYIFQKKDEAILLFHLEKGSLCHIKSINITGLERVKPQTVLSHIYLHPKDPFDLKKIDYSYRKLYSLQYFRFVNIDYSRKINNNILLDINLKERQRRNLYKAGLGFDTQNGLHLNFFYKHLNLNQFQPKVELFYSNIKKSIDFSLFYPSIQLGPIYVDTLSFAGYERNRFDTFSQSSFSIGVELLKEWFDLATSLRLHYEKIKIFDTDSCIRATHYDLLYPKLLLLYDQRNSKIAPTSGYYLKDELAFSLLDTHFIKNSATLGFYLPFSSWSLFGKVTLGTIFAAQIPPNKRFYAGGATSNRAYTYRQLHALDSDCALGAKTLLETTLEPRFPYNDRLTFALFWDRSYLSVRESHIGPYRDGVGVGALYKTPMGELKFYFGIDPNNSAQNAINISLGATF